MSIPAGMGPSTALRRTGAYLIAVAYAAFWVLQVGVLYEFHEGAFAPLLIALAILLSDERRWPLGKNPLEAVWALVRAP